MPDLEIVHSDNVALLKTLPEACLDSLVTDPPYGLGKPPPMLEVLTAWLAGEAYKHKGKGFMAKSWDAFVPGPEVWKEAFRVLKPGAQCAVFAGARTFDLMGVALRLAGLEIRDTISAWLYGQGNPKGPHDKDSDCGVLLKPCWEPIILCRKPFKGTIAANLEKWGTGRLNTGACRVKGDRWPPNVILAHHPNCPIGDIEFGPCHPDCQVAALDFLNGERKRGSMKAGTYAGRKGRVYSPDKGRPLAEDIIGSVGGVSDYFYCPKASREERELGCEGLPVKSGAEVVGRKEGSAGVGNPRAGAGRTAGEVRNTHVTVKPLTVMEWLVTLCTPPGGTVLDLYAGSGTTICAAGKLGFDGLGIELEEESARIAQARVAYWGKRYAA